MRLHKANYSHLYLAALALSLSDRQEMDCIQSGRDPVDVLTASENINENTYTITDYKGSVLAVGGIYAGSIWFVHTTHAEKLSHRHKLKMFRLLRDHLKAVHEANPYTTFGNMVSVENLKHQRLLHLLGANFKQRLQHNGHWFWLFTI